MKKISDRSLSLIIYLTSLGSVLIPSFSFAQTYRQRYKEATGGIPLRLRDFQIILESFAGFLIVIAGVLAGVAIIISGIMYMSAGSDSTRLTTAKAWFKNGIIGALILFAVGLIIQTLLLIATDPYGFSS